MKSLTISSLFLMIAFAFVKPTQAGMIHGYAIASSHEFATSPKITIENEILRSDYAYASYDSAVDGKLGNNDSRSWAEVGLDSNGVFTMRGFVTSTSDGAGSLSSWTDTFVPDASLDFVKFQFKTEAQFRGISDPNSSNHVDFGTGLNGVFLNSLGRFDSGWDDIQYTEQIGGFDFVGYRTILAQVSSGEAQFSLSFRSELSGDGTIDSSHTNRLIDVTDLSGNSITGSFASGAIADSGVASVPEPSTLPMFALIGLFGATTGYRRSKQTLSLFGNET